MDDVISRQQAIDALAEDMPSAYTPDGSHPADEGIFMAQEIYADCIQTLKELPSALGTNLAEVGRDCISRQAAIDAINCDITITGRQNAELVAATIRAFADRIKALPSAQPKRGKWIRDGHHIRCDQCGMYMCDTDREGDRIPTEFCPHCGAKMEVTE